MPETNTESLKREIDTSRNKVLEIQELEEFLKSNENIKRLGDAMNSNTAPELIQEFESSLKNLCENILNSDELTENQQKILSYFIKSLGDKYPEIKERIYKKISSNETKNPIDEDISTIQQEIDNDIMLQSTSLSNLQELGIDISLQNNKKLIGIKRGNVINDIKKLEDISKINNENINQYLTIPSNIPKGNYTAIAENIKEILYKHLQLHPGWKAVIGNEGYSSGMSLKTTYENDKYEASLHQQIQKLQKKSLDEQIKAIEKGLPNNSDLLDLWLKTALNSKKNNKDTIIQKFFDKISSQQSEKFFKACEKNKFINELKNSYAQYRLIKNNCIKTGNGKYCFLDWMNKSKFENFKNKGIELKAGNTTIKFDDLYNHTQKFYESIKKIGLDATIPIENMLAFEVQRKKFNNNKKSIDNRYNEQVRKNDNPYVDALGQGYSNAANLNIRKEKIMKISIELDKEYAKLLLLKKPKPTGRILGISGAGVYLDFSKGNNPEKIVRDSFREQLGDQREKFKQDLKNDRQAAFGSAMGMVGGIAGSAGAAILSGNILITSAGFTAGLRLGNGVGQELWNSGEFLYEQTTGNIINDGNNKVEDFGQGFLRGVGVLDQNYEYVGTDKFLSGLGFDYLSTVATFGLSQKFGGFLGKLEGVKFAGGALKFGMEELILENFFVDIPMNIVQTGFETFTGIDDGVTIGNTAIGNQHTIEGQGEYKSGSISDMLKAMKDATTQNLSFENLSQTFFNTVLYGGFLEGGGAAIKKMKGYLPAGQVSNFTEKSAAAATAFAGLTNFMSSKNINLNKDGVCIDTKTNLKIEESDPRFQELCTHLNTVEATKAGVIESFETIMETQKQMVSDPENKTGLLFRLGLISPTNTPVNILKKKKELVEKKLNEAQKKGDNNKANQLQKLLDIYTDAEIKLNNSDYFNGKSHQFEVTEAQARGNSEMMDNLLSEINEQNKSKKLEELRKEITEQYKQSTGENLELSNEQLLSILNAHEQDGELGKLKLGELKIKVKILSEAITDEKVIRFLLEAGFCGQEGINDNYKLDINRLAEKLNLNQSDIDSLKASIESINIYHMQNGIDLRKLPIFEIIRDNYEGIKNFLRFSNSLYKVATFFRYYLAQTNQELSELKNENNKKLQEILSNFSEDIKNKCKNAGIDIDEKLRILKGEISLEEAKQICSDEEIIKLAQDREGTINIHALELATKLKNFGYYNYEIEQLFGHNNEYIKITELIEDIQKALSMENLSIDENGRISIGGKYSKENDFEILRKYYGTSFCKKLNDKVYEFKNLLNFYLIDGGKYTEYIKVGNIKHNILVSHGIRSSTRLFNWYTNMNSKEQSFLAKLIYNSAYHNTSEEEKQILIDYKGDLSQNFNKDANNPNNEDSKALSHYLEGIPLEEDIEVIREDGERGIAEKINISINGKTMTLHDVLKKNIKCDENCLEQRNFIRDRFISTTFDKSGAFGNKPIKWHFIVKKGVGAYFLDVIGFNSEGEILLDKNCRITITKLDVSGGVANIYANIENVKRTTQIPEFENYFNGKPHKIFEGNTGNAESNSKLSDRILNEVNEQNKSVKLEELRKEITEQYKQSTGEELQLSDEQLLSILDAHEQDGKLGELTLGQLKVKVKILSETITDPKVRRFLLEAGFCGNKSGTEVLGNTEKTEFIQDFFNIDKIKSIEELKEKGDYLYFNGKNKRKKFKDAIFDGDFELAKKLYTEALNITKDKLKKVGLTPEQNKFIVDCFRRRDYNGIKKILEETKKTTKENTQVEDTEKKYSKIVEDKETGEKRREYDNIEKAMYKDPITEKEVLMTRRELHERIIEKFLLDGEASKGKKQLIMSGGLPGAGKSTIEKSLEGIPKVIVNPDLVKDYLPEYYDELGRKFGAGTVHEESSYISKIIYDRAIKGGYSILYDSSMKDKPYANPPFPKYDKIVESAYNQGYKIQARFIYDGGESRYRNAVIRERSMGLDNYNAYGTAYKTIEYLSKDKRVDKTIIYDNSGNGKSSSAKIIYENQQINMAESDQELINKFNDYQTFLDNLL